MVLFQAKVATISARPLGPFWLGLRWLTAGRLVAEAVSECQVERNREKRGGWGESARCVYIRQSKDPAVRTHKRRTFGKPSGGIRTVGEVVRPAPSASEREGGE